MSKYTLVVKNTEDDKEVFSWDMNYEKGKLKFMCAGKPVKAAIAAYEDKKEEDIPEYQKTHNAAMKPIDEAIDAAIKAKDQKRFVIYSVYKNYDNPENNLQEIAVEGTVRFVQEGSEFFGNGSGYKSEIFTNPTWLDVAVCANEMMLITGDMHHCYLEAVYASGKFLTDGEEIIIGKKGEDDEVVRHFKISMGS